MIPAYDKVYLKKAQQAMARMLDFAVHELHYDIEEFFALFLSSIYDQRFESGDFSVLVGMSGVELTFSVLEDRGIEVKRFKPQYPVDRSEEYWTGWVLAYYQWYTALPFSQIVRSVPVKTIQSLYTPYHEMDIRHFVDQMNHLYRLASPETNLQRMRRKANLTQAQLSEMTGVSLRTLQDYEQRKKNINKAQAETILMLAQGLCCDMEALLERIPASLNHD